MKLHLTGPELSRHMTEEIALLTGRSALLLESVQHQQVASHVSFVLERFPLTGLRGRLMGAIETPEYAAQAVRTLVEIFQVEAIDVMRSDAPAVDRVLLERGLQVTARRVFASSVEEVAGRKFFVLSIKVTHPDIRLTDVGDA